MTKDDAARKWVSSFNVVPQGMIEKLVSANPEEWEEITVPAVGNEVYLFETSSQGVIENYSPETDFYTISLDNNEAVSVAKDGFAVERDSFLPMWRTMWSFKDAIDDYWLEEKDGIRIMSECGFRIYEHKNFGYFFGIDGYGYDFYKAHWLPLYEKRGLRWHTEE